MTQSNFLDISTRWAHDQRPQLLVIWTLVYVFLSVNLAHSFLLLAELPSERDLRLYDATDLHIECVEGFTTEAMEISILPLSESYEFSRCLRISKDDSIELSVWNSRIWTFSWGSNIERTYERSYWGYVLEEVTFFVVSFLAFWILQLVFLGNTSFRYQRPEQSNFLHS